MNSGVVFRGGLPYRPDINRLDEAFPPAKLTEGAIIKYEDLEPVIQQSRDTPRFHAVVKSWMNHQRNEFSRYIIFEKKVGVRVLAPGELLLYAEVITKQKMRQTGRAMKMFGWVDRDRLDDVGQKRLDHQARVVAAAQLALASAAKQLAPELAPVRSLPKPALPK